MGIKIVFPKIPTRIFEHSSRKWEHYFVESFLESKKIGRLTIDVEVICPQEKINDFWYNSDVSPPEPRPVVCYQDILKQYRGRGLCGQMLIAANEIAKKRFNQSLASDIVFVRNPSKNPIYHPNPAERVWEKLEGDGLAILRPINYNNRWVMK